MPDAAQTTARVTLKRAEHELASQRTSARQQNDFPSSNSFCLYCRSWFLAHS